MSRVLRAMVDADANAEGRDVFARGPVRVSVGWLWLEWTVGIGAHFEPTIQDGGARWGAYVALGPAAVGFIVETYPGRA